MSTLNNETVSKLNEALTKLIGAYEDLQNENHSLDNDVKKLKKEKEELLLQVKNLENNINVLNNTDDEKSTSMNSMLGKIESLLGVKDNSKIDNNSNFIHKSSEKAVIVEKQVSNQNENFDESIIKINPESENKIDLNRMASLLNGFNNK